MQLFPIKTRVLIPPKDDLYSVLDEYLTDVREGDVVLITSKVVAIHEGRSVSIEDVMNKDILIQNESELFLPVSYRSRPITVIHNAVIASAGIDESNGAGYYILLPVNPFNSAKEIHRYVKKKFGLTQLGIVLTDSHSEPLRYGAMSISIGCWGLEPVVSHVGKPDLFGRETEYAKTNMVDALSAAATLVSGECAEACPIVIARDVQNVVYTEEDPRPSLFVPYEEDIFRGLFEKFEKGGKSQINAQE